MKKFLLSVLFGVMTLGMTVSASEYTVTNAEAVLYTNAEAELLSNADANSVVLSKEALPDNAPIHVTGITSNGYFRVDLDGIYYIAGNGLQEAAGVATPLETAMNTAANATIPPELASLRVVTSLTDIPVLAVMTDTDWLAVSNETTKNIKAKKYEKIRYVASNGEQFCMWNVCVLDTRHGESDYSWLVAPTGEKFSNGYNWAWTSGTAESVDKFLIKNGMNISGSFNECMINRDESIPLGERTINTPECPVELYTITDRGNILSMWVEGSNCYREGIGTCGGACTGTCIRSKSLDNLEKIARQKGMHAWGEDGRIHWNGKLLVNFYYMY